MQKEYDFICQPVFMSVIESCKKEQRVFTKREYSQICEILSQRIELSCALFGFYTFNQAMGEFDPYGECTSLCEEAKRLDLSISSILSPEGRRQVAKAAVELGEETNLFKTFLQFRKTLSLPNAASLA